MATAIDDNAAYEKSDKSIWWLLNIRCTRRDLVLYRLETARNDLKSAKALFSIELKVSGSMRLQSREDKVSNSQI